MFSTKISLPDVAFSNPYFIINTIEIQQFKRLGLAWPLLNFTNK